MHFLQFIVGHSMISIKNQNNSIYGFLNKHILNFLILSLILYQFFTLNNPNPTTTFQYAVMIIFLPLVVIIRKERLSFFNHPVFVGIMCCLVYGIFIGLLNSNDKIFILRNAAGFFSYLIFFCILSFFNKKEIESTLLKMCLLANSLFLVMVVTHPSIALSQLGHVRYVYSPMIYFCFIGFIYYLDKIYNDASTISLSEFIIFSTILLIIFLNSIVLSLSKGAILGLGVIVFIYFILIFIENFKKALKFVFLLLPVLLVFLWKMNLFNQLSTLFPSSGNVDADPRFLQNEYLWREATVMGSGFGSYLHNGFLRDPLLKYAYEATFFNYINKLGAVSIILWSIYAYTLFLIVKAFFNPVMRTRSLIALSSTIFFYMGLGNPTLFSPSSVLIHVSILFLLHDKTGESIRGMGAEAE